MSRHFSFDFSDVRLYLCEHGILNTHAFAMGSDLFFCAGSYAPYSVAGSELLAHELAHVVQQRGSTAFSGVCAPDHGAEADAWCAVQSVMEDRPATLAAMPMGIYRHSVPQPRSTAAQITQFWQDATGQVGRMEVNRLAAIYTRLQMQDQNESINFRWAVEPMLTRRLPAMNPWAVALLAGLSRHANRTSVHTLVNAARAQLYRMPLRGVPPPPAPYNGPSVNASTGGWRPLTPYEQRLARYGNGGDPFAENLADFIGTPRPSRS